MNFRKDRPNNKPLFDVCMISGPKVSTLPLSINKEVKGKLIENDEKRINRAFIKYAII